MKDNPAIPRALREFYKSSPMREGILCWYPFEPGATALDLSHGALTGLLKSRRLLLEDGGNTVDYIIAIDPEDLSIDALRGLYDRLKPHGRLLLAYENPFGLRYWSGKRSPGTNQPYDSLYGLDGRPGKAELQVRLKQAGFGGQKWYYPLTDHWFTREIYSEAYPPDEYLNQRYAIYIANCDTLTFNEGGLYREIIRGGAFEFMCGAYLVEARVCGGDADCPADYVAVTAYRDPSNRFATAVRNDGTAHKIPLHPDALRKAGVILQNHEELEALGVKVVKMRFEGEALVMPRMKMPTLCGYWNAKLSGGGPCEAEIFSQYDRIRDAVFKAGKNGKCYWELVPANCFYDAINDALIFFDQEYCWTDTPPEIALVRAVRALSHEAGISSHPRAKSWMERLKIRYGLVERWDEYSQLAGVKAHIEVFGSGDKELYAETARASARFNHAHYCRKFAPVGGILSRLGFKAPAIYGYGVRGKALKEALESSGTNISAIIDKNLGPCKIVEDIPPESDVIVVSIQTGDGIADELRSRVKIPVYTLEDIISGKAQQASGRRA